MNIKKYFKVSTIASVITSLLLLPTPTKALRVAQPKRIAMFVDGYTDCCVDKMYKTVQAFEEMGIEVIYNAWDSVSPITGKTGQIENAKLSSQATERFKAHLAQYFSSLPEGTEIYLIGHSFGGDSILQFLNSYNNFRTRGKGAIRIRLAAVIDPTGYGGLRANAIGSTVHQNVDYFYNRWQENAVDGVFCLNTDRKEILKASKNCVPFDSRTTDGRIANCNAKIKCDEKEQNIARNSDSSAKRVSCQAHEITCEGWTTPGCTVHLSGIECHKGSNGTKQKRLFHSPMPYDDYIQQEIIDIVKGLVVNVNRTSSSDFIETLDIPIFQLNRPNSFEARFRAVNDWASKQDKYIAGFPNFHQAPDVFGTVLFKKSNSVEERGIPISELGNPRNNEERFRAVNDWAVRNGYSGAFPNFHQGNSSQGVAHGTILLKKDVVESKDIPVSELGNPRNNEERFRAVNDWAVRNGYAAGFPNFHQADYGKEVVHGTILIKKKDPNKAEVTTTVIRPERVARSCSTDYLRFQIINGVEPNNFRYKFAVDSNLPSHELLPYARFTKDTQFIQTFTVRTGLGYPTKDEPCPTNPVVTINGKKVYIDRLGKPIDKNIPQYVFVKQVDGSLDLLYIKEHENVKPCSTTSLDSNENAIFGAYWNDSHEGLSTCTGNSHR